jgi:hypothetical protein
MIGPTVTSSEARNDIIKQPQEKKEQQHTALTGIRQSPKAKRQKKTINR